MILSQVEKYAFNIVEKGISVNEEVEVDEDEQTEVIRIPKHNDVAAMELLNDFDAVIYKTIYYHLKGLTALVHRDSG